MTAPAPATAVRLRAYAKVNLALSVGAPAGPDQSEFPPGYHPIASWMAAIDLHDDVTVEPLADAAADSVYDLRFADGAAVGWPLERDLAVRAHLTLQEHTGNDAGVRITIRKRIPTGAGLGGGSADAAAALVGLNRALGLGLDGATLRSIGLCLGADIPFFIDDSAGEAGQPASERAGTPPPRPAVVSGIGGEIVRLPGSPRRDGVGVLLICPPFGCETGLVYRRFDALGPGPLQHETVAALAHDCAATGELDPELLFNDLAEPAMSVEPRLAALHESLQRALDRPVHVSGSGSTLFVVTGPTSAAELEVAAAAAAKDDRLRCTLHASRLLQ